MADPTILTAAAESLKTELPANIGSALALVPALEWAKRNTWQYLAWVNEKTAPSIAVIVAAFAAAGIHGTFGQTWDPTTGTWHVQWTIANLTFLGFLAAMYEIGKQWLGQHWIYKFYQGFDTLKSLAKALNQIANIPTPSVTGATTGTGDGKVVVAS